MSSGSVHVRKHLTVLAAWLAVGTACSSPPDPTAAPTGLGSGRDLDPPAAEGSLAPELVVHEGRLLLSWLEPWTEAGVEGHRLRLSTYGEPGWSTPVTVVGNRPFFANWADRPGVTPRGDGGLIAYWLEKTAADTYAYTIRLAGSEDGGASWEPLGKLNDDVTDTEHGFVSWVPEGDGARAFWLDGRATAEEGPMTLRTALVERSVGESELLDERVCDCCSTDAVSGPGGPVVVFRDRSDDEIRDMAMIRRSGAGWSETRPVHEDGWKIEGCPVNGPEMETLESGLAVVWFSAPDERSRVQLAFADEEGRFSDPLLLDGDGPVGRVGLAGDGEGGVFASWLGRRGDEAQVRLAHVARDGAVGPPTFIADASKARSSGVPRLVRNGQALYLAWVDAGGERPARLRVREIPVSAVPGP